MIINLPLGLTIFRLIASLCLPVLLVEILPQQIVIKNVMLAGVFLLVSLTDVLDGYLARRNKQVTTLGALLDPLADKLLLLSGLIALLTIGRIDYWFVIILLGREFFVMGLRLVAKEFNIDVPVSKEAKRKTVYQMLTIAYLIAVSGPRLEAFALPSFRSEQLIGRILLNVTLCLSVFSAWGYADAVFYRLKQRKVI